MKNDHELVEEGCHEVWYECKNGAACVFFGCNQWGVRHRHMVHNAYETSDHPDCRKVAVDLQHRWYRFPDQQERSKAVTP